MAKGKAARKAKKGSRAGRGEERGLMSSAGLMRYYDVEESAVKLSPKTILLIGVVIGALVLGVHIWWQINYGVGPWT